MSLPKNIALRRKWISYTERFKSSKFVHTNDNWCGTYDDGTVKGSLWASMQYNIDWKTVTFLYDKIDLVVSFWGNDDLGLTKYVPFTEDVYFAWLHWLNNLVYIDIATLKDLGFEIY